MNEDHRELDLKVAELLDRVKELEEICFKPASDERKMKQGYYKPLDPPSQNFYVYGAQEGNTVGGAMACPPAEILKVTPEGKFIWHKDAQNLILHGDFVGNPSLRFILQRLLAVEHIIDSQKLASKQSDSLRSRK